MSLTDGLTLYPVTLSSDYREGGTRTLNHRLWSHLLFIDPSIDQDFSGNFGCLTYGPNLQFVVSPIVRRLLPSVASLSSENSTFSPLSNLGCYSKDRRLNSSQRLQYGWALGVDFWCIQLRIKKEKIFLDWRLNMEKLTTRCSEIMPRIMHSRIWTQTLRVKLHLWMYYY